MLKEYDWTRYGSDAVHLGLEVVGKEVNLQVSVDFKGSFPLIGDGSFSIRTIKELIPSFPHYS